MKYLIYATILGFSFWITSELLEIIQGGYSPTVYYLTAAYHILAGFGIWGLHLLQAKPKNTISLIGTLLISVTYFALARFPLQVMHSGLSVSEFLTVNPAYKIPGGVSLLGFIIFGIAVIKTKYFPRWSGMVIILATLVYAVAMAVELQLLVNINNIILALVIIYMSAFGLTRQHLLR